MRNGAGESWPQLKWWAVKRLVDYNPMTGVTTWFEYHPETDITIVAREQDVEPLLERTKDRRNDPNYSGDGIKNSWWHYASYPPVIIERWKTEYGIDILNKHHQKEVLKKVNSPEWRYLKNTDKVHT